jgi:hypothetical protein
VFVIGPTKLIIQLINVHSYQLVGATADQEIVHNASNRKQQSMDTVGKMLRLSKCTVTGPILREAERN